MTRFGPSVYPQRLNETAHSFSELDAIALGSGYTARANQRDVLLTRKTTEGTNTYKVPLTTQLYPGDIVFVRERWF